MKTKLHQLTFLVKSFTLRGGQGQWMKDRGQMTRDTGTEDRDEEQGTEDRGWDRGQG